MTIRFHIELMSTEVQLDTPWNQEVLVEQSPPAPQETISVTPPPPTPPAETSSQYYNSPAGIILATCALVTAIGRVLQSKS